MNKNNLVKLAKFILSEVTDEQFRMSDFRSDESGLVNCDFKSLNDCGTVGCALGWAPFVEGLEVVEDDFNRGLGVDFFDYSERVFVIDYLSYIWDFLFGDGWSKVDNSREGFVRRVIYLLEECGDLELDTNQYKNINPNKIYDY